MTTLVIEKEVRTITDDETALLKLLLRNRFDDPDSTFHDCEMVIGLCKSIGFDEMASEMEQDIACQKGSSILNYI